MVAELPSRSMSARSQTVRKLNSLFAVLVLSGVAVGAQAQVTMTTANRISGGYGINLTYNGVSEGTSYAGPFATSLVGPGFAYTNFDSYCVDVTHSLLSTETVTVKDIKTAIPASGAQIAYLYNTFAGGVGNNALKGAALQIAIWEVEYDYGIGSGLNLNAGNFLFTSVAGDDGSNTKYNSVLGYLTNTNHTGYLDHVPSNFGGTVKYLEADHPTSNTAQSLIGPANVPEPGMVSLLASSLIGMSAFAIRRRCKA